MRPLIQRREAKADIAEDVPEDAANAEPEAGVSIAVQAARAAMAKRAVQAGGNEAKPAPGKARRDPAPSRVAYRFNRLWLTPFFRLFLRVGAPMALSFAAGIWYFDDEGRRLAISAGILDIRRSVETRPEFMVQLVAIEGASPVIDRLIRENFPMDLPVSSFDLDLEMMQAEMAELDVLESVSLRIRPGGVLEISVKERQPAVVWRSRAGIVLLDDKGILIDTIEARNVRADLPLLAGEGAQDHVEEALALIRIAAPIRFRLRGLVRVGQRRWDLALTRDQHILLPENDPASALQQILALDQAQDLLARDLTKIDMRNPLRPSLRMAPAAIAEMRRIKAIELGDPDR